MAAQLDGVFVNTLSDVISKSKILVVGAGGIGCEILKNLVLSGIQDIEVIDLDTIDVSNLNRQFLFHKEHVGKSKAEVARQSALEFNPNVTITAYHDSITTPKYGVSFFKKFNLVLNALDNRQARNHVNRMCLTADVPLIESGTAGYNGQVEFIKKGMTLCYECTPKAAQKTFPGCTIRNTPSEPIHCIVWAKHLFNQLFGETNEDEEVSPDMADPEAGGENAGEAALNTKLDDVNGKGDIERVNTRQWAKNLNYDPDKLFNKFFHDDIKYLLSMSNLWKNRSPPQPIKIGEFPEETTNHAVNNATVLPDQRIWSLEECYKTFSDSIGALKSDIEKLEENDHLVWDKDDKSAMDFVAACANIRAKIFNIPVKSRFDIKSMAGNIIPAIATTNAITAGVVVMHAFKVLSGEHEKCKSVYMRPTLNPRNFLLVPEQNILPPNPKCYVCAPKPSVCLQVDTSKLTVKELRDDVFIKTLNMIDPDVMLESKGLIVISSEEGETDCNNNKKLNEIHIVDGVELKVDDFLQQYELSVLVFHADAERDKPLFEIVGDRDAIKTKNEVDEEAEKTKEESVPDGAGDGPSPSKKPRVEVQDADEQDDDDLQLIEDDETEASAAPSTSSNANLKRKPADNAAGEGCSKKAKIDDSDDDLIMIEDDD